jgi:hypothetical protein
MFIPKPSVKIIHAMRLISHGYQAAFSSGRSNTQLRCSASILQHYVHRIKLRDGIL